MSDLISRVTEKRVTMSANNEQVIGFQGALGMTEAPHFVQARER